jgi:hypothetical protein
MFIGCLTWSSLQHYNFQYYALYAATCRLKQFCRVVSVSWVIRRGLQLTCHNVLLFASLLQPLNANTYYSKPLHVKNLKRHGDLVVKNRSQLWGLEQVDIEAPKYIQLMTENTKHSCPRYFQFKECGYDIKLVDHAYCTLHVQPFIQDWSTKKKTRHTAIIRPTQTSLGIKVGPQNKQPVPTHLSKILTILPIVYRIDETQKAPAN